MIRKVRVAICWSRDEDDSTSFQNFISSTSTSLFLGHPFPNITLENQLTHLHIRLAKHKEILREALDMTLERQTRKRENITSKQSAKLALARRRLNNFMRQ
jgi:hypothetical protein